MYNDINELVHLFIKCKQQWKFFSGVIQCCCVLMCSTHQSVTGKCVCLCTYDFKLCKSNYKKLHTKYFLYYTPVKLTHER